MNLTKSAQNDGQMFSLLILGDYLEENTYFHGDVC